MKKFVYEVAGFEFQDAEAFGAAWHAAKILATDKHVAIYRQVVKHGEIKNEVFCTGGCFLRTDLARPQDIKIF